MRRRPGGMTSSRSPSFSAGHLRLARGAWMNRSEPESSLVMMKPSLPPNEAARLDVLREYDVLDTPPEAAFDDLVRLASQVCGTSMAMVSLIDGDRQWYKARVGTELTETPRDVAFCAHAILGPDLFIVPDAETDERFADN